MPSFPRRRESSKFAGRVLNPTRRAEARPTELFWINLYSSVGEEHFGISTNYAAFVGANKFAPTNYSTEEFRINGSAAAHRDDHFQPIAIRQLLRRKGAAQHDLAVALQRDALAGQPHLLDKGGDTDGLRELACRAVDADRYHFASPC